MLTRMIVCLHCHETLTSRLVLFTRESCRVKHNGDSCENPEKKQTESD